MNYKCSRTHENFTSYVWYDMNLFPQGNNYTVNVLTMKWSARDDRFIYQCEHNIDISSYGIKEIKESYHDRNQKLLAFMFTEEFHAENYRPQIEVKKNG